MRTPSFRETNVSGRALRTRLSRLKLALQGSRLRREWLKQGFRVYGFRGVAYRAKGSGRPAPLSNFESLHRNGNDQVVLTDQIRQTQEQLKALRRPRQRSRPRVKHDRRGGRVR